MKVFAKSVILSCLSVSAFSTFAGVPDCISDKTQWPGDYYVELKLAGRSTQEVAKFINMLTVDPIWPGTVFANQVDKSGKHVALSVTVEPNMNRFPKGTTLEQTRPAVEKTISQLMALPGVTVTCPEAGE